MRLEEVFSFIKLHILTRESGSTKHEGFSPPLLQCRGLLARISRFHPNQHMLDSLGKYYINSNLVSSKFPIIRHPI